jgi:hypothetical protein
VSSTTSEALAALVAVQMRLRTFRVIPVVNRSAHRFWQFLSLVSMALQASTYRSSSARVM